MRLIVISDSFPPVINSCSHLMYDISKELSKNHKVYIFTPSDKKTKLEKKGNLNIHYVKSLKLKNINYLSRLIGEFIMPFLIIKYLKKINFFYDIKHIDGIVSYSPSIFFLFVIRYLKSKYNCKNYLILRDIFPDWVSHLNIIKFKPFIWFLKIFAKWQYDISNYIALQSINDQKYFKKKYNKETLLLYNWKRNKKIKKNSLKINKNFFNYVYIGNVGPAQDLDNIIKLAAYYQKKNLCVRFYFYSRGFFFKSLQKKIREANIKNCFFSNQIPRNNIEKILANFSCGIISLNKSHILSNIPGKFLDYLSSGIPVLADINKNNELEKIIELNKVGLVNNKKNFSSLCSTSNKLIKNIKKYKFKNCEKTFNKYFTSKKAAEKIIKTLSS